MSTWFQLEIHGQVSNLDKVQTPGDVADLKHLIRDRNPNKLATVDAMDLVIEYNGKRLQPMEPVPVSEPDKPLLCRAYPQEDLRHRMQLQLLKKQQESIDKQDQLLQRIAPFLSNAMDKQWSLEQNSVVSKQEHEEFRQAVFEYYGMADNHHLKHCHFLGIDLNSHFITIAHIFARRFRFNEWQPLDDVDSPENVLILFKPIERAFDHGRLCFVWDQKHKNYRIHVLDPKLFRTTIAEEAQKSFSSNEYMGLGKILNKTFGDFHGEFLDFLTESKPYKTCMTFHCHRARCEAIRKRWIKEGDLPEIDTDDAWSPEDNHDKQLQELIQQWRKGTQEALLETE
ncbi:hypothetical protein EDD86DRAFT_198686 [Gorgonomyces haynaldii]|nr:hypothetical protein EDD86DRAFT_198686 [Gorgonomyces haynaldii]